MKVKIGDTVYDAEEHPILIILSEEDKKNIKAMPEGIMKYCVYPNTGYKEEEIRKWIEEI